MSVFLRAVSCASVPSSSIPIKRQEPATSAARIAASRRSTCSLLKMHPRGSGKLNVHIAQLCVDVRLTQCPPWVNRVILVGGRLLAVFSRSSQPVAAALYLGRKGWSVGWNGALIEVFLRPRS